MSRHWQGFGNAPSPALRSVWSQIAETFNRQITDHASGDADRWRVLQAPTGTGKTQSLAVYCALLPETDHPGVLVVTRLISQAEEIVRTINALLQPDATVAGPPSPIAGTHHTDHPLTQAQMRSFPVLVITQRAYEIGLDKVNRGQEESSSWESYHAWSLSGRALVVIDEAIDIVQEAQTNLEPLKYALGMIPENLADQYPGPMRALRSLENVLRKMREARKKWSKKYNGRAIPEKLLWRGELPFPAEDDMTALRRDVKKLRLERFGIKDPRVQQTTTTTLDTVLRDAQAVMEQWNWYHRKLQDDTINTARLIVPETIKGAVVLDATASQDVTYQLFDKAEVIPLPAQNARTYRNVRLHYSTGHALGNHSMGDPANVVTLCEQLVANLRETLPSSRKVFIVTHQRVEDELIKHKDSSGFAAFDVGHYGALDGRNDWRDYDTVVIFGLHFLPSTWAANRFMALQGMRSTEWLNANGSRPFKHYQDVRKALDDGNLIVSTVQAINRVRCRRVINADGDCPPTAVFLLLPQSGLADTILNGIRQQMPGIVAAKWQYDRLKRAKPGRKANVEEALTRHARSMMVGTHTAKEIRAALHISNKQWKGLVTSMRNPSSALAKSLADTKVCYHVERRGETFVAYLVKEGK